MYCSNCGTAIRANARFCGKCGQPAPIVYSVPYVRKEPEVVYVEEKPLTPILEDKAVVALTFCVLILSIATIILSSAITKDIPTSKVLKVDNEKVLRII